MATTYWVRAGRAEALVRIGRLSSRPWDPAATAAAAAKRGARELGLTNVPESLLIAIPETPGQFEGIFEVGRRTWGGVQHVGFVEVLYPFASEEG